MSTASGSVPEPHRQRWATRRMLLRYALLVLGAGLGGYLGWTLAPPATAMLGPFGVNLNLGLTGGGSTLDLPPFGQVAFPTHAGPLSIRASISSVDPDGAQALVRSPDQLSSIAAQAPDALRWAVFRAALWCLACTSAGAALGGWAIFRTRRRVLQSVAVALTPIVVAASIAGLTVDQLGLQQPRFTGLLSRAPYLAGQGRDLLNRLENYRTGVTDMLRGVSTLYSSSDRLPALPAGEGVVTVLHISDVHLNPQAYDLTSQLIQQFHVNVVVDTGDVVNWGTTPESVALSRIPKLPVPYVFIRGNHDSAQTAATIAKYPNATVLDSSTTTIDGLTFAGIRDATFTPDGNDPNRMSSAEVTGGTAQRLAQVIRTQDVKGPKVDVALIHNAAHPEALFGLVPLVLAGHIHKRDIRLDEATGTRVMVEGSTGGAGITTGTLNNFERDKQTPLEATLLYFSRPTATKPARLLAYDEVTVGGLGLTSVEVARTMVPAVTLKPAPTSSDSGSPSDSATSTSSPSGT